MGRIGCPWIEGLRRISYYSLVDFTYRRFSEMRDELGEELPVPFRGVLAFDIGYGRVCEGWASLGRPVGLLVVVLGDVLSNPSRSNFTDLSS